MIFSEILNPIVKDMDERCTLSDEMVLYTLLLLFHHVTPVASSCVESLRVVLVVMRRAKRAKIQKTILRMTVLLCQP